MTPADTKLLTRYNAISSAGQGLLFVFLVVYIATRKKDYPFTFKIGRFDAIEGYSVLNGELTLDAVLYLLAAFTLITSLFHALYASGKFGYIGMVDRGNNTYRWAEYSVTATLMLLAISLLSGVGSSRSLILIAVCCFCCMWMGQLVETAPDTKSKVLPTVLGWALLAGAYGTIFADFDAIASSKDPDRPKPPDFVKAVVVVMFGLFSLFGFLQIFWEYFSRKGPVKKEVNYTRLSMVSKLTLVALVAGGVIGMRPKDDDNQEEGGQ